FLYSIEYCEEARELYAESNSYFQDAITNFEEAGKIAEEKYKELIDYYTQTLDRQYNGKTNILPTIKRYSQNGF
ncbi:hypothetical protein LCGC14_3011690, partial [marine sediment metagenome]